MRGLLAFACMAVCAAGPASAVAAGQSATTPIPPEALAVWESASSQLGDVVRTALPDAEVTYSRQRLEVSVNVSKQGVVRPTSKSGEMSPRLEIGPEPDGLHVIAWIGDGIDQAMRPQLCDRPPWQVYLDRAPIKGTGLYIKANIAFGKDVDRELIHRLRSELPLAANALAEALQREGVARQVPVPWGEPVDGLQAALVREDGAGAVRVGDTVSFRFDVRNAGTEPIRLTHTDPPHSYWSLGACDSAGEMAPVLVPPVPGSAVVHAKILDPGETVTLMRFPLAVRPVGWEGPIDGLVMFAAPREYTVRHTASIGMKPDWCGCLATAPIALNVKEADGASVPPTSGGAYAEEGVRAVLLALQAYGRLGYPVFLQEGDPFVLDLRDRRKGWAEQCAALSPAAVAYLGYVAAAHPDEHVRARACMSLGATKKVGAAGVLVGSLTDPSVRVRCRAARALGDLRSETHVAALQGLAATDPDASVRADACYALGHIGSRKATDGLLAALQTEDNESVRGATILALGWIADPTALDSLKKLLEAAEDEDRRGIEAAIRNIEDPEYWDLGVKGGVSDHDLYRFLVEELDLGDPIQPDADGYLPDPFTRQRQGSDRYVLIGHHTRAFGAPEGDIIYLPDGEQYYVRENIPDSTSWRYYGPFEGNPHDLAREKLMATARLTPPPGKGEAALPVKRVGDRVWIEGAKEMFYRHFEEKDSGKTTPWSDQCGTYMLLAQMRIAGWDIGYPGLNAMAGYGPRFGYAPRPDDYWVCHYIPPIDREDRIAHATGCQYRWRQYHDVEDYWQALTQAIDEGQAVYGPNEEGVLFIGYVDATEPAERRVMPLAAVFVEDDEWTWGQFTKWHARPMVNGWLGRIAKTVDPHLPKESAIEVMAVMAAAASGNDSRRKPDDGVTWGVAGVEAYARDLADVAKSGAAEDKGGYFQGGWRACHNVYPQISGRPASATYLKRIAPLFDGTVRDSMLAAAVEYDKATESWGAYLAQLGGDADRTVDVDHETAWTTEKYRKAGAAAVAQAAQHERAALDHLVQALTALNVAVPVLPDR
ncbi:MAG: hypothetical protein GY851_36180 [bacterium]|nr:hypothetical protein [bacterium]